MTVASAETSTLRHRDDLQGLRAIAVLIVVLGHCHVRAFQGGYVGVDVFFVLSGYLITGLLFAGAEKSGTVSLSEFYVRRARRILPAAALTLVVTDVASWLVLNFVRAKEVVIDSLWASVFGANIHFAAQNSDYFARTQPPSPLQNFWTLSVEEQFYLVWPLVLGLVLFGAVVVRQRRSDRGVTESARMNALAYIVLAGAASLAWSIHTTDTSPASAYFSTLARAWELALGAALAIVAPRLRNLPDDLQVAFSAVGLACIGVAAVTFSSQTRFPGYAALLPTLGAALVIAAGIPVARARLSVLRVLALAPFRYVGDRSYALYLWHWPVLILAAEYVAPRQLSVGTNLLLAAEAFVLSIVSYAFVENPIRHLRFRRPAYGLLLWPASLVGVLAFAVPILGSIDAQASSLERAAAGLHLPPLQGAAAGLPLPAVLASSRAAAHGSPIPSPLVPAVSDVEREYELPGGCAAGDADTSSNICRLGDLSATKTLVVVGDSHALMWMPTILNMAKRDHWLVRPIVKTGCAPKKWFDSGPQISGPQNCTRWYEWAVGELQSIHPTVTLVVGKWSHAAPADVARAMGTVVSTFRQSSGSVVAIGDPIEEYENSVDCLLARGATMATCSPSPQRNTVLADRAVANAVQQAGGKFMDVTGWFCARPFPGRAKLCPAVVNRTIVMRDVNHVSQAYALELTGRFRSLFTHTLAGS